MTVLVAINAPITAAELNVVHDKDDRNNDISYLVPKVDCVVGMETYQFCAAMHYGTKSVEELLKMNEEFGNTTLQLTCAMVHKEELGAVCVYVKENFYTQNIEIML